MTPKEEKTRSPAAIRITPSESELLVRVATARNRRVSLTVNPPPTRAVTGLISKGLAVKVERESEIEITTLGQQRCTSIY